MTRFGIRLLARTFAAIVTACLSATATAALTPGDLALICNHQVPASIDLAKYYAKQRGISEDRIIELDLPDTEMLPAAKLDPDVIFPIRRALTDRGLRSQVKCLVTFYGVPLKVGPRTNQANEAKELTELTAQRDQLMTRIMAAITSLESAIKSVDSTYRPASAIELNQLVHRADTAIQYAQRLAQAAPDDESRRKIATPLLDAVVQLGGPVALLRHAQPGMLDYLTTMPTTLPSGTNVQKWNDLIEQVNQANEEAQRLLVRRYEPQARARLRELTGRYLGLLETYRLVSGQIDYLAPEALKSLDSELPLLWVNSYDRKEILSNPLKWDAPQRGREQVQTLMVMRLDGPQSGTAREIIMSCLAAEKNGGLEGTFAIDSRGLKTKGPNGKLDSYGDYDQRLRDLVNLVQQHGRMSVLHDDSPEVFKPHVAKNIALYCGWYSVRNYVPSFEFVPGAVGFHIASFEMVSLRNDKEKGWCRGLLNDGIAATLGPVDEPYLGAFPDPVEFFSLLLTGKYTLGEVYWLTTPTISWKMAMIGDPLYNPYGQRPALEVKFLPAPLRNFVAPGLLSDEPALPAPAAPLEDTQHLPGHL